MKQSKKMKAVERFFKDNDGNWKVAQFPNLLLSVWVLLLLANLWAHSQNIVLLQRAVLFSWAYLELTEGVSSFRKTLGAVVLAAVTVSFFNGL